MAEAARKLEYLKKVEGYSPKVFPDIIEMTMQIRNEEKTNGNAMATKIEKIGEMEFIGKIKKECMPHGITGFWEDNHKSGYTDVLYSLQENYRDFGIMFSNNDYMICIEKPEKNYNEDEFDHVTIKEGIYAIVYGKWGDDGVGAGKGYILIEEYLKDTDYIIDESRPMIEKFPDDAAPLDQTYALMRPIKKNEESV